MKVLFDTKKVQKMGRISLTDQLLRNAGLQEGDAVDIYFDAASKRIILERAETLAAAKSTPSDSAQAKRTRRKA